MPEVMDVGFRPDERIGNYRVECELGPTGFGVLLQVRHLVLPRRAIMKVVHAAFASMHPFVVQTLREACILEAIAHPGVPIIYESGLLQDRRPWFAFEVIDGPTLEELLAPGAISVMEVAGLLRDLADILEHTHRRGVIHCGLRPDRVVLTTERRYPLCIPDWSDAITHDATSRLPQAASAGASHYVAPELGDRGELVDDRVDMFALGVIAYRGLTGTLPFGTSQGGWPQVPAHMRRPDAPRALTSIIDSLLAFDRFDRPSATEVRVELDLLFGSLPELQQGAATREPPRVEPPRPRDDVVPPRSPRLRRPRWTPDVRYLETTRVDIVIADEDRRER